jgi:hypothetical protein
MNPQFDQRLELLRNFGRTEVGHVIGIAVDIEHSVIKFYRNGELLVEVAEHCGPSGGLCPAVMVNPGDVVEWNVGLSPFKYPLPQGLQPWAEAYASQDNEKKPLPSVLEVEDVEAARWLPVATSHNLTELMVLNDAMLERQRAQCLAWVLFLLTLPQRDTFFNPPVVIEYATPPMLQRMLDTCFVSGKCAMYLSYNAFLFPVSRQVAPPVPCWAADGQAPAPARCVPLPGHPRRADLPLHVLPRCTGHLRQPAVRPGGADSAWAGG